MEHYNVKQVCLNGHIITNTYDISPERRQTHCNRCGAKTIIACPHCDTLIRGRHYRADSNGSLRIFRSPLPEYCHNCGQPYPWTKKLQQDTKEEKKKRLLTMRAKKQKRKWFKNPAIIVPALAVIIAAVVGAVITGILINKGDPNIIDNRSHKMELVGSSLTYYFSEMKQINDDKYVRELNLENVGNIPVYNLTINLGFDKIIQKVEHHFSTGSLEGIEESGTSNSDEYYFKTNQLIPSFSIQFICSNDTKFEIVTFRINDKKISFR